MKTLTNKQKRRTATSYAKAYCAGTYAVKASNGTIVGYAFDNGVFITAAKA